MLGSLIVGIFSLQTIELIEIPKAFVEASIYSFKEGQIFTDTIELALLLTLIFVLAKCMQETGAIKKLIDSLKTFFSRGGILGAIPAVYGLMPVPGGALFSAPLIEKEGEKFKLDKNQKNFLNVWFRHIWFPIYPISSAMILICSEKFSNINIYTLIAANIPAFIAFVLIGVVFLKFFIRETKKIKSLPEKNYHGLIYLLPPTIPLVFYAALYFVGFPRVRSFLIGILFSILLLYYLVKIDRKKYIDIIKKSLSWNLALAIFGIMIFREMFSVSGADVFIANIMSGFSFPALIIVILIPFILGLLTGYNLGAIALSYPLIQPFFEFTEISLVGLTSLIFISSIAGYLISPIHLCNVLSSDYLKTDTTRMYKMYIPAVFFLLLVQTIIVIVVFAP
jgi:integral membrane protein (TIGR00529 family)